jgi:hypothetical protein
MSLTSAGVVHVLWHGAALCGIEGPPSAWSARDRWVGKGAADEHEATCARCVAVFRGEPPPPEPIGAEEDGVPSMYFEMSTARLAGDETSQRARLVLTLNDAEALRFVRALVDAMDNDRKRGGVIQISVDGRGSLSARWAECAAEVEQRRLTRANRGDTGLP